MTTAGEPTTTTHLWAPITDLAPEDLELASDELKPLSEVWADERTRLADDAALRAFNERLQREWAIETGILEKLYTLDRGVTQLLIERGIDSSLIPNDASNRPPEVVATIIRDQEHAVDYLFDLVAQRRPLSVSFIKELHALMTRHQSTTAGVDQFGNEVEIPLVHGCFKQWPNNPTRADGSLHEYCPPEQVDSEMDRLIDLHHRHHEAHVPPDISAAWLHHRFTQIHPFQDGNGRVARAIASLVFIQNRWFPLVITRDDRVPYLEALESADAGELGPLTALFATRQKQAFVRALGIAREVTQEGERLDQQLAAIQDMFRTRDAELRKELEHAKEVARAMWNLAGARFDELAGQLNTSMAAPGRDRRAFVAKAGDDDAERRNWNRWQVIQGARELGYFAGLGDFSCWVSLAIQTEAGRGDILLSLHTIGHEFKGVIGASVVFYRRHESAEGERQSLEVQTVSDEIFQINYKDDEERVAGRFNRWLEDALVKGLDAWRRTE